MANFEKLENFPNLHLPIHTVMMCALKKNHSKYLINRVPALKFPSADMFQNGTAKSFHVQ